MGKYDFELEMFDENTISWIADKVLPDSRVLEFGPANGRLTKYLKNHKNCRVDIVEIDQESGAEASEYAENVLIGEEDGNIENYYWLQWREKYDYIIFADVLEHLVHPDEVLKRCKSIIKEEGKVLVSVPNIAHNSIIIELMNDKFNYNATGILDNTHLRFFTRSSFEQMALSAGWAIVEEKAKNIRVGETEIRNSYKDVSKEMYKELAHRAQGNVYQYMFTLALSEKYLLGECERIVSMDSSSYYYAEIQYDVEGMFDYRKSVSRHFDPYNGFVNLEFPVDQDVTKALIKPINCNCVLADVSIRVYDGETENVISEIKTNGTQIASRFYFMTAAPEIEISLPKTAEKIVLQMQIMKYDFEDEVFCDVLQSLVAEREHIVQVCNDYEGEQERIKKEFSEKEQGYNKQIEENENEIEQLKKEISRHEQQERESARIYENEILRRENERLDLIRKYEERKGFVRRIKWHGDVLLNKIRKSKVTISSGKSSAEKAQGEIKKVTAVIPNYNYARYLDERIDSILAQTYPVSEIIILDDCSKDNSIEVINRRIQENQTGIPMRLVANEKNSGSVFAQWQKAFQLAKGEFVWIAEADDSCNEKFLETVMAGFRDRDVVISYCESLTMDEKNVLLMGDLRVWIDIFNTGKWNNDYVKDGKEEVAETMCINNTIANVSSAVIRNDDYFDILEEAKTYKLAGDWYTYMNILKRGKIAYFKESLNYHRMQTQGLTLSTSHEKEFEEIVRLQNFALENFVISDDVKAKVFERRERERKRFGL